MIYDLGFKNKKVLVLGLGLNQGGVGSARFFAKKGARVKVTDLKSKEELKSSLELLKDYPEIEYTLGEHKFEDIDWADLIIRNPALKPDNKYLLYALQKGKHVEMDMGIFLQYVKPEQLIGVTGTKGKSTTTSLINNILKEAGREVIFAGNIGKSVLDIVPHLKETSLVLLELSSFQLQAFHDHQISPHWSIITNIYPDHLNYHETMENYIKAKWAIAQYQKPEDYLFLSASQDVHLQGYYTQGQVKYFSASNLPKDFKPLLPGQHNLENMAATLAVVTTLGVDEKLAYKIMSQFKGIDYRLQLIYDKNGIKIYNDSAATNPESTIQALKSLPDSILICGGVDKGLLYDELAQTINQYAKAVYFLEGSATDKILNSKFLILNSARKDVYKNLGQLVKDVKSGVQPGNIILFSPGAASFNLFQNEFDRGQKFNEAVEKIFSN